MWYPTGPDKTPRILLPCPGNDHTDIEPGMIGIKDESNNGATWVRPFRDNEGDPEPDPIRLATVDDVSTAVAAMEHDGLAGDNNSDAGEQHYNSTPATGGYAVRVEDAIAGNPDMQLQQRGLILMGTYGAEIGGFGRGNVADATNLYVTVDSIDTLYIIDRHSGEIKDSFAPDSDWGFTHKVLRGGFLVTSSASNMLFVNPTTHEVLQPAITGSSFTPIRGFCQYSNSVFMGADGTDVFRIVESGATYAASPLGISGDITSIVGLACSDSKVFVLDQGASLTAKKIDGTSGALESTSSAIGGGLVHFGFCGGTLIVVTTTMYYELNSSTLSIAHSESISMTARNGFVFDNILYAQEQTGLYPIKAFQLPGLTTQSPTNIDMSTVDSSTVAQLRDSSGERIHHSLADFQRAAVQASAHDSTRQVFDIISIVASSATEITDAVPGQRYLISDSTQHNNQLFEMQSDGAHWYPPTGGGRVFDHSIAAYVRYDASRGKWSPETFRGDVDIKWTGTQTVSAPGSSNIITLYSIDDSIIDATGEAISFEILATGTVPGQNRQVIRKIFGTLGYPLGGTDDGGVAMASVDEIDSITTISEVTSMLLQPKVVALNDTTNPGKIKITITVTCSSTPASFDIDWDVRLRGFVKTGAGDFCS